ncbi:hypothetical protein T01_5744 [Trichinella spiralis]|uniref:Uncharacterized protein n=1 Tax=Trichinella spiralis TaxID=6334 RepID=A0A0V0ZM86_TRISP|nr:hypothetical protein T01_5744 [Trichinella spiralis]
MAGDCRVCNKQDVKAGMLSELWEKTERKQSIKKQQFHNINVFVEVKHQNDQITQCNE